MTRWLGVLSIVLGVALAASGIAWLRESEKALVLCIAGALGLVGFGCWLFVPPQTEKFAATLREFLPWTKTP